MKTETCITCGIVFEITDGLYEQLRANGKDFYCPMGHGQHYNNKQTLEQKLAKMTEYRDWHDRMRREYFELLCKVRRRESILKRVITRLKNHRFIRCPRCGFKK